MGCVSQFKATISIARRQDYGFCEGRTVVLAYGFEEEEEEEETRAEREETTRRKEGINLRPHHLGLTGADAPGILDLSMFVSYQLFLLFCWLTRNTTPAL